ncbi:MAG: sugar ABC transporter permease [Spirochaetales bacterium]|nr:ABC transporter permease subunit [Spirochaetota bacterium]NLL24187.1 sugar ABC transporter permease [Spirochaetales bacterium]HPY44674.1 ABC transporter permease subunit [Sphaerochaeta sp.]HQB04509.1 ABC transporter permease subunit [Sphaerochaeta sp.]
MKPKKPDVVKPALITRTKKALRRDYQLLLLCAIPLAYFVIVHYIPMYGVQIAFKDFKASKGIWESQWVGLKWFRRFFSSSQFWPVIRNTLGLSFLQILLGFPVPILLAILLNQVRNQRFRKFVQSVVYSPHFISIVVLAGMLYIFLSPRNGFVNTVIKFFGGQPIFFLGEAKYFKITFVLSGIWQHAGWSAIIYIAALAGISPDLYEAAEVDGANKWQRVWHIDLPGILPTIVMMLILEMGKVMNLGFQKAYLMQNAQNLAASEIISTYIYKVGLINAQYSYSTAINLFNNVVNIILLVSMNALSRRITQNSLW